MRTKSVALKLCQKWNPRYIIQVGKARSSGFPGAGTKARPSSENEENVDVAERFIVGSPREFPT